MHFARTDCAGPEGPDGNVMHVMNLMQGLQYLQFTQLVCQSTPTSQVIQNPAVQTYNASHALQNFACGRRIWGLQPFVWNSSHFVSLWGGQ